MLAWTTGTDIAIWGTGKRARKFYYRYCKTYKVNFFIDNFPCQKKIMDIKIIHPQKIGGVKTVIAIEDYLEVCKQCKELGMVFFDDYLPYDFVEFNSINFIRLYELLDGENVKKYIEKISYNKRYAVLIGNCQITNIKKMLLSSITFQSQYLIIDIPPVYLLNKSLAKIIESNSFIFENCSLCITQYINTNNGYTPFLGTENIKTVINKNSIILIIPTLYCDLYFPQTVHQDKRNEVLRAVNITVFPYGDCILNELAKKYSVEEIQEIVKWDNLFSERLLRWHYQSAIEEMLEREKKCDVIISDYILKHFRSQQLFYTKNHPVELVFCELGMRILHKLGFKDERIANIRIQKLDACQELIYPSVSKFYNFTFVKELYLDSIFDEECCMDEMVRMYLICLEDKAYKNV